MFFRYYASKSASFEYRMNLFEAWWLGKEVWCSWYVPRFISCAKGVGRCIQIIEEFRRIIKLENYLRAFSAPTDFNSTL